MSQLTIGQAAKILGVSKKTLMRWDNSGRFSPTRETVSNIRVYEESVVRNLKVLLDHERRYSENIRELRKMMLGLNNFSKLFLLSDKEGELLDKEEALIQKHKKLMKEFEELSPKIKVLYKQFYINRWTD